MPRPLTTQQQRVLETLHRFVQTHGRAPSRRELAQVLGYRSANSIQRHFKALEDKGYVKLEGYKWRGAKLLESDQAVARVPLVGNVACGLPLWAEENVEGYVPIQHQLLGGHRNSFLLRAKGDSMDRVGIGDGQLLLVEPRAYADAGEIVVALLGDEATVKVYQPGRGHVTLVPRSSNPEHKPIIVSESFLIQGVVRRVF